MNNQEYILGLTDIWTHAGKFHADDVFCYTALRMMGCTATLHRVNQLPDNLGPTDLAFDIGGGKYDHHKEHREIRSNGIPYASFGLIMKDFYLLLDLDVHAHIALDRAFVKNIDSTDNRYGTGGFFSAVIGSFNPVWDGDTSEEAQMEAFLQAASMAETILKRQIENIKSAGRAKALVPSLLETVENHTVFMDCYAPVERFMKFNDDVQWICFASTRGGWTIKSVAGPRRKAKAIMPKEFRGVPAEKLPEGMTFCHPNGFNAAFDSLLSARVFAKRYLAKAELYTGDDLNDDQNDDEE